MGVWVGRRLLDDKVNETFLYHGTNRFVAAIISKHGFVSLDGPLPLPLSASFVTASHLDLCTLPQDERMGSLEGLYGAGTYFTHQSCKASQYAESQHGVKILLMARVTLGDVHYVQHADQHKKLRRAPLVAGKKGLVHDSVVANEGQARTTYGKQYHREYIVYDRGQSYPEYVVYFKDG